MGIYILGLELPPIDEYLHLRIDGNGYVSMQISENQYICDLYDTDKKAIELPPHGRAIDADAMKVYQMEENVRSDGDPNEYEYDAGLIDGLHMAAKAVSVAPTVIPADPEKEE